VLTVVTRTTLVGVFTAGVSTVGVGGRSRRRGSSDASTGTGGLLEPVVAAASSAFRVLTLITRTALVGSCGASVSTVGVWRRGRGLGGGGAGASGGLLEPVVAAASSTSRVLTVITRTALVSEGTAGVSAVGGGGRGRRLGGGGTGAPGRLFESEVAAASSASGMLTLITGTALVGEGTASVSTVGGGRRGRRLRGSDTGASAGLLESEKAAASTAARKFTLITGTALVGVSAAGVSAVGGGGRSGRLGSEHAVARSGGLVSVVAAASVAVSVQALVTSTTLVGEGTTGGGVGRSVDLDTVIGSGDDFESEVTAASAGRRDCWLISISAGGSTIVRIGAGASLSDREGGEGNGGNEKVSS